MAESQDFVAYVDHLISALSEDEDPQSQDRPTPSNETLIRIIKETLSAWESPDRSQGVQAVTLKRRRENEEERTLMLKQRHKAVEEDGARVREELERTKEELKMERTERRKLLDKVKRFKYELRRVEKEAKEKEKVRELKLKEMKEEFALGCWIAMAISPVVFLCYMFGGSHLLEPW